MARLRAGSDMKFDISWSKVLFLPACLFFFSELVAQLTNWYSAFPWIDIPMHLIGGFLAAITLDEVFRFWRVRGYLAKFHPLLEILFLTSLVVVIAVFWEFHEFLRDTIFYTHFQISQGDTMHDLLMGMTGGLFASCLLQGKKKKM